MDAIWQNMAKKSRRLILIAGIILFPLLAGAALWFYGWKRTGGLFPLFVSFLLLGTMLAIFHGRTITNDPGYVFRQFRYQYLPNALICLILLALIDRLIRARPRRRYVVYPVLGAILFLNLFVLQAHIAFLNRQMAPLGKMLQNIRAGLQDGRIEPERKIYLDDEIAAALPPLCWNTGMEHFMDGTYQWLFPPSAQASFAGEMKDAAWIVETDNFTLREIPADKAEAEGEEQAIESKHFKIEDSSLTPMPGATRQPAPADQ